jgi:hypothetical protein
MNDAEYERIAQEIKEGGRFLATVEPKPTTELLKYEAMCKAIAEVYEIDEVKDIRDKALAIQYYARQAQNTIAERQACEIRLRAERKGGQLLKERKAAGEIVHGARGNPGGQGAPIVRSHDVTPQTLNDFHISKKQSSDWQKLADIPDDAFEEALKGDHPTTGGIIAAHAPKPKPEKPQDLVHDKALWLWGKMLEFEREGVLDKAPEEIMETMLDHMRKTTLELAPKVAAWLGRFSQ